MRRLIALFIVLAGIALVVRQGVVIVRPQQIMVISHGDRVIGVRSPGLNWHWPFVQSATLINVTLNRRQDIKINLELVDSSTCPVRVRLIYRFADPVRAFKWRRSNGVDVFRAQPISNSNNYSEAGRAFVAALQEAGKGITPSEASAGGIEKWIRHYQPSTHKDGARTQGIEIKTVDCSQAFAAAQQDIERKRNRQTIKGPVQALSRHLPREGVPSDAKIQVWSMEPMELMLRDSGRVVLSELKVHAIISDRQKFEAAFGPNEKNALRVAAVRSMLVLTRAMRSIAGTLNSDDLQTFDPFVVISDHQSMRQRFAKLGFSIVDFGGQNPGYQTITYKYD